MNKEKSTYSQVFAPPEGYFGQVCVCCAMSADDTCIEKILTFFSGGKNNNTRAFDRKTSFFLMLNQGHPNLNDTNPIYGLCQLTPKTNGVWDSVYVQHAKVAVMQFGKTPHGGKNDDLIWRYVICTGNWTDASAKSQLEMVWSEDIQSSSKTQQRQKIADLVASSNFLQNLKELYNCSETLWDVAKNMFEGISSFQKGKLSHSDKTRFFSTLPELRKGKKDSDCILNNLSSQFFRYKGRKDKNYVVAGSGFFEEPCGNSGKPEVFKEFDEKILKRIGDAIEKRLVINPDFAGRIALWKENCDWDFFSAKDPASENRKLHAKYIFIGEKKHGQISNGLLYLGSGNLSIKGLLSSFGKARGDRSGKGNIEAGIVVKTDTFLEKKEGSLLSTLLVDEPISIEKMKSDVLDGDEAPPNPDLKQNPVFAINIIDQQLFSIEWNPDYVSNRDSCLVKISTDMVRKIPIKQDKVCWVDWNIPECPRCQWLKMEVDDIKCIVPMLAQDGLLLPYCRAVNDFDGILAPLNDFPKNIITLDDDSESPENPVHRLPGRSSSSNSDEKMGGKKYLYGEAMKLIEGIASYNNEYFPKDSSNQDLISSWITTIDTLLANLTPDIVKIYTDLKIDFISVLKNTDGFAPCLDSKHKKIWDDFIDRWVKKWGLDSTIDRLWMDV